MVYKELYIGSYRIVGSNPKYSAGDGRDDIDDDHDIDNIKLTSLYNTRYMFDEGATITVIFRSLYNTTKNMFHKGAINVVLRGIHVAIVINSCQWRCECEWVKRQSCDSQVAN